MIFAVHTTFTHPSLTKPSFSPYFSVLHVSLSFIHSLFSVGTQVHLFQLTLFRLAATVKHT